MKKESIQSELGSCSSCADDCQSSSSMMSRRKFMSRGALAVGAAGATVATTGGLGLLTSTFAGAQTTPPTCATTPGTVKHPRGTWGYPAGGLDAAVCAERAYHGFYVNACCWAVVDGVLGTLQDQLGSPYTNIDLLAFKFGGAGVNGWGTLCGTALGAALCTNIVAGVTGGVDYGSKMSNDALAYYAATSMPVYVPSSPEYAALGGTKPQFLPGGAFPTSVADSPLCHVSTNKWMTAANIACGLPTFTYGGTADPTSIVSGSIERKERCARLAGSMAYKVVELLNAWKAGTYSPGAWGSAGVGNPGASPAQKNCTDCHTII